MRTAHADVAIDVDVVRHCSRDAVNSCPPCCGAASACAAHIVQLKIVVKSSVDTS